MILTNEFYKADSLYFEYLIGLVKMLYPVCPFICEELYQTYMNSKGSMAYIEWPKYDEKKIVLTEENISIQINGKLRNTISVAVDISKEDLERLVLNDEKVRRHLEEVVIKKVIVVPHRVVNIVVGEK